MAMPVFRIILLFSALLLVPARADDTFTVLPQQAVTIGDGNGDSFMLERISPNDNSVVVLLRPKGEDCTFRFAVDVGRSVQLRIDSPLGQSFLCQATLRPIVDSQSVQFSAACAEKPASAERRCPPGSGTATATPP
jgi:hypothetical protein